MGESNVILIRRVNGPSLKFRGERLAHTKPDHANRAEEGRGWTEFEVYLTAGKSIVIVVLKKGRSIDRTWAFIADSWQEVKEAFDHGEKDGVRISWSALTVQLIEKASAICPEAAEILMETVR
ncbi:MAG: hypothetical protein WC455_09465 [Dehalococcoidia bacterium]|jgi:hypothetical protein